MPVHKLFKTYLRDRRGYVAVVFGILALPLVGIAGAAIDYRNIGREYSNLQTAAESAAVAAARAEFVNSGAENSSQLADKIFDANYVNDPNKIANLVRHVIDIDNTDKTVTYEATADAKTTLLQVIGFPSFAISVRARAAAVFSSENVDVHFVLDLSPSMGTPADGTPPPLDPVSGCFFMCHDNGDTIRGAGKTPKMDVIFAKLFGENGLDGKAGLIRVIGEAVTSNPIGITGSYNAHGFEHHFFPGQIADAAGWSGITNYIDMYPLVTKGYILGNDGVNGGTDLKTSFSELHTYLSTTSPAPPNTRRIIILVSDGMHARAIQPFDPAVCTALKGDGDVFTLYVKNSTNVYDNPNLVYVIPGGPDGGRQARDTWWDSGGILSAINNGGTSPLGYYTGLNNAELLMKNCATKDEWAYQGETQTQLQDAVNSMGEAITSPVIRVLN